MTATLTRLQPATGTDALPSSTRAPARRAPRDPWLDNAKMLLVTLVVVGHAWTMLAESFLTTWSYNFLYLWHVPAFVMVTGYLSRSFTFSRRHLAKLVTTVVVPYLVFELALTGFRHYVGGEQFGPLFLNPHWPMWYLATLFVWRLATPLLHRLPHALPAAVVVSLVGGAFTGDTLDIARAAGLLPFFVVGLLATPQHLAMLRRPAARVAAVGAFGVALVAATAVERLPGGTEWLYWRSSYAELEVSFLGGAAGRLVLLAAAGALALAFLALLPGRGGWFSRMGAASLVVYLCHGFAVKAVEYTGFPAWSTGHPTIALVTSTLVAVAVTLLLASPPVARRLTPLVDPVGAWQRRRRRTTPVGPSEDHRPAAHLVAR